MTTRKQALNELADVMEKHKIALDVEPKWNMGFDLDIMINGEYIDTLIDEDMTWRLTPDRLRDLANQQEERDGE